MTFRATARDRRQRLNNRIQPRHWRCREGRGDSTRPHEASSSTEHTRRGQPCHGLCLSMACALTCRRWTQADAFFAANTVPMLVISVSGVALSSALVPLLAGESTQSQRVIGWTFVYAVTGVFATMALILSALCDWWVPVLLSGFDPVGHSLTVTVTQVQLLMMVFGGINVVQWSMCHARRQLNGQNLSLSWRIRLQFYCSCLYCRVSESSGPPGLLCFAQRCKRYSSHRPWGHQQGGPPPFRSNRRLAPDAATLAWFDVLQDGSVG